MTITVDLSSPVSYSAGDELEVKVTFTAPQDGIYYLLGALYDTNYNYISGSMFGFILPTGATYAINSDSQTQLWSMVLGDTEVLPCKLTLGRTSVLLGLFLMRMTGTEPSLDDDVNEGSVTLILVGEAPPAELDLNTIVGALVVVGMMGVMMKVMLIRRTL